MPFHFRLYVRRSSLAGVDAEMVRETGTLTFDLQQRQELDLPPDARCRKCAYLLRGLTMARCPECGEPFELKDFSNAQPPLWPALLGLFFIGLAIEDALLFGVAAARGYWFYSERLFYCLFFATAGLCIYMLRKRECWSCAVALIFSAALFVLLSWSMFLSCDFLGNMRANRQYYLVAFLSQWQLPGVVFSLALLVFLTTGNRRRSMASLSQARRLAATVWNGHPKGKWLPLMLLILLFLGLPKLPTVLLAHTWQLSSVEQLLDLGEVRLIEPVRSILPVMRWLSVAASAMGVVTLTGAVLIWRWPGFVHAVAGTMLGLCMIILFACCGLFLGSCIPPCQSRSALGYGTCLMAPLIKYVMLFFFVHGLNRQQV